MYLNIRLSPIMVTGLA